MNIYQTITDRILNQLESGAVPWRKTWTTGLPKSLTTGREYRGVNILVLGMADFRSRYWVTYREAQRLGGQVRKGERATPVIYWKWRTDEEIRRRMEQTGKVHISPCVPFTSAVFNLDQVDGIDRPADDVPKRPNHSLEVAAHVFEVMPDKPQIEHRPGHQPTYSPRRDRVLLPHLSQFEDAAAYYATLFHELVHATGHPRRLDRFQDLDVDAFDRYGFEELVAEFGAAFLMAFAGIATPETDDQQASYIAGWAEAIRNDDRLILQAASAAQRAADYIRGKLPADDAKAPLPDTDSANEADTPQPVLAAAS